MAKQKQQALVKWNEELAKQAALAVGIESNVGGGRFIGTAGGRLKVGGAEVPGNQVDVVILDHVIEYAYYEGIYDPSQPQPPVCYAFGRDEKLLAPHEQSSEKQNAQCVGCPQNEFGSAERGKGKACKNSRRLAVITAGDLEDLGKAEVMYLKVPVTSVKAWAGYVRNLNDALHKPPFAVVTTVKLESDPKTQFRMLFNIKEELTDASVFEDLIKLREKVSKEIEFPYQAAAEQPAKQQKNNKQRRKY